MWSHGHPPVLLDRPDHRVDQLRGDDCVVEPGAVLHAGADALDEPPGLDDLEVVVPHGDAGAGLERTELTVTGPDQPRLPGRVLEVLVETRAQLAHPAEVPRQRPV